MTNDTCLRITNKFEIVSKKTQRGDMFKKYDPPEAAPLLAPCLDNAKQIGKSINIFKVIHVGLFFDKSGVTKDSFRNNFDFFFLIVLGSFLDRLVILLGSFCDHFGIMLGSRWNNFGITLEQCWNHVGTILG